MKYVYRYVLVVMSAFVLSCGGEKENKKSSIQYGRKEKSIETDDVTESQLPASEIVDLKNKGIGPISSVTLNDIDNALVEEGENIYKTLCAACHRIDKKFIGPKLKGILERRTPEWVMNMTLNPIEMTRKDPLAKALFEEYGGSIMANQNLSTEQARAVLEYMRSL